MSYDINTVAIVTFIDIYMTVIHIITVFMSMIMTTTIPMTMTTTMSFALHLPGKVPVPAIMTMTVTSYDCGYGRF